MEKKLILVHDYNSDDNYVLKLTEEQINVLRWVSDNLTVDISLELFKEDRIKEI